MDRRSAQHKREANVRRADRENNGSCYYDRNGQIHFSDEELVAGFSVAAAWSGLRKSWLGYKIAKREGDEEEQVGYARAIVFNCRMLQIEEPLFLELMHDKLVLGWPSSVDE